MTRAPTRSLAPGEALTSAQVAELVGGKAEGPEVTVKGVQELSAAGPDQAAFFRPEPGRSGGRSGGGAPALQESRAGLLLLPEGVEAGGRPCVRVADPPLAAALLARHFHPAIRPPAGVHPSAIVADSAEIGPGVSIGPGCVVEAGCRIGADSILFANVFLGGCVELGRGCVLHPGVVLYQGVRIGRDCTLHGNAVIGADGFGYVWDGSRHVKVPQIGTVEVGDGVEIGAGTCIDRATFGATRIGAGSILDNQVQVAHNCEIGRNVVLCGQVALAGSTVVGDNAVFGGRAMTSGHLRVGRNATVVAGSAVIADVPDGLTVGGLPARDWREERRARAALARLLRERGGDGGRGGKR